jgi:hypothetical protein
MDRIAPPENVDLPKPWERTQITRAQWEANRDYLMRFDLGSRHDGWWLYERNMDPPNPPYRQARILYEMGELKGGELEQVLEWFRGDYAAAHQIDGDRIRYWKWKDIPPSLIAKWDARKRRAENDNADEES